MRSTRMKDHVRRSTMTINGSQPLLGPVQLPPVCSSSFRYGPSWNSFLPLSTASQLWDLIWGGLTGLIDIYMPAWDHVSICSLKPFLSYRVHSYALPLSLTLIQSLRFLVLFSPKKNFLSWRPVFHTPMLGTPGSPLLFVWCSFRHLFQGSEWKGHIISKYPKSGYGHFQGMHLWAVLILSSRLNEHSWLWVQDHNALWPLDWHLFAEQYCHGDRLLCLFNHMPNVLRISFSSPLSDILLPPGSWG